MKFKLELILNKPRIEVWKAFDNVEDIKLWQPSLISVESLSGTPGQPGAISKLTYEAGSREFVLMEKITHRDEPRQFNGVYENQFADNTVKNSFIEQGEDQTLWVVETEFVFKTFLMKIMGPLNKKNYVKRTQRDMERFKEMVESQ